VHRTNQRFWNCFNNLPKSIQILARKNFGSSVCVMQWILSIVFDLERTNQLNLLPDKDLVDLCPPIEPYQVTKNQNFELLKSDLNHPSLSFKKVGKFWSARVGINYRALAFKDGEDYIWVWIGSHEE